MGDEYIPTADDVLACPNGCSKDEIELGTDQASFMAIVGAPYKYLRCGKCGFGEENKSTPGIGVRSAVEQWNKLVSQMSPIETEK